MATTAQPCSTPGCDAPAAYRTRKQPAWCLACLDAHLQQRGLEAIERFPGNPQKWWLTRCLRCGVVAHYRLAYVLEKNVGGEATCRACFWETWTQQAVAMGAVLQLSL